MRGSVMIKLSFSIVFGVLLSAVVTDAFGQTRRDRNQSEQAARQADRAFDQRDYRTAINGYATAVTLWPGNSHAQFRKGQAHFFLQENEQAVTHFDLALKAGHKAVDIYKARWEAYARLKRYDEALADISSILRLEPSNYRFALAAADINLERGNFQAAVEAYQKAIAQQPNNADLYYRLAFAKSRLGDIDGQASAAEEAIKRNTQFLSDALLLLGAARHAQKRVPEAIDAYSRALASRPDRYAAYRQLAELYRSQNRIDEAIEISKAGLRIYPNDGDIFTDLSWFYSLAGRTEDAIEAGRAATQLLPQKHLGFTNLCRAYNEAKKPELAISACNSALRLSPEDGETLFYLGRANAELKRPAEAEKFYRRAVTGLVEFTRSNPDYSDGYYLLGNAYAEVGQNAKAVEAYKKCLDLNPRFAKASFNIGIIRIIERNKEAAMEQYNALLQTDKVLAQKLKAEIDKL